MILLLIQIIHCQSFECYLSGYQATIKFSFFQKLICISLVTSQNQNSIAANSNFPYHCFSNGTR